MAHSLEAKFQKACCLATFLASQEHLCEAQKLQNAGLELIDLAQFKYLLPDEVTFEYQDTPFDAVFGEAPTQKLVFAFNDKRARKRKLGELQKTIRARTDRFKLVLDQFLTIRGSIDDLKSLAKVCLPDMDEQIPSLPLKESTSDAPLHVQLFNEMCASLKNFCAEETVPARAGSFGPVPDELAALMKSKGYDKLYEHQSKGLYHLLQNSDKHLVVSTSTASGKSLIFHSVVQHELDRSEDATAMFLYPTKALAQDQLRAYKEKGHEYAYAFDGDVDWEERDVVRKNARVLFVNPDILHTTLLPKWNHWTRFFSGLRYVVIDEMHYYAGIFGANVAMVLRRLRRLCYQLGAEPCQYIGCSATLAEPSSLMATLTGFAKNDILELTGNDDGSPSGAKRFVFCTPDFVTPEDPTSGRLHPIKEAVPLIIRMVRSNLRVIAFCRFRRECELLLRAIYDTDPELKDLIMGYRGGYSKEDRRRIESMMFSENLRAIVSTTALEVGIDIGNLDAAVIVGFPHSISSFRQQVGRVGRRQHDSLVVYIADGSGLNQAYAHDIQKVLYSPIQGNPIILHESIVRSHIQCAAYELALQPDIDLEFFPQVTDLAVANLEETAEGTLLYPVKPDVNLRKAEDDKSDTMVVDAKTNKIIERVEFERVGFTLYEGAIFIHQGKPYLVVHLDPDLIYAKVQRTKVKWITRQRDYTDVDPINKDSVRAIEGSRSTVINAGMIKVTNVVFGYFKFNELNQIIDEVDVKIPPSVSYKYGIWINLQHSILSVLQMRDHHIAGSIHAAEHALISVLPLFTSMAPGDTGTECKAPEKEFARRQTLRQRPARLILYEKYGGRHGNGILRSAYNNFDLIIDRANENVDRCPCDEGCIGCVCLGNCVEHNAVISKRGAQVILRLLLGKDLDGIPCGPEPNLPRQQVVTVVPVEAHTGNGPLPTGTLRSETSLDTKDEENLKHESQF